MAKINKLQNKREQNNKTRIETQKKLKLNGNEKRMNVMSGYGFDEFNYLKNVFPTSTCLFLL